LLIIISILDKEVYCEFCSYSSKNKEILQKCGPIYGPFKDCTKYYYLHENCAIWSPKIHMDSNNYFKNVKKEIKRSKQIHCSYCGKRGGGIGCSGDNNKCIKTYHYLCAKLDTCVLDNINYLVYCKKHHKEIYETANNTKDNYIIYEDNQDAKYCQECKSGLDEDKLLLW